MSDEEISFPEYIVYPDQIVQNGAIAVSPDLIANLFEALPPNYTEGDIGLRVSYADFKFLVAATGATIREIRHTPEGPDEAEEGDSDE